MTDDARPDPRIGTTIGAYRIERVLGRGGMGVVYLAQHLHLERPVALKVLSDYLAHDDAFRERFIRESRMAASLRHPNIIPVYDAGEQDGVLFIAMQYVEGGDLADELDHGPLSPDAVLAFLEPIASALDKAHASGIVHRDVKPANIMLGRDGGEREVYLTDFGLVRQIDRRSRLTQTGTFVGTLDYAAPEMFQNTQIDGRVDQYSLACVLYECCTGDVPFPRDSEGALIGAHLADPPPAATAARGDLPDALDPVIARGMAKAPGDRYGSCSELMAEARSALTGSAGQGRRETVAAPPPPTRVGPGPAGPAAGDLPPAPPAPSGPRNPRRPWFIAAAAFVAVALVVGVVLAVSGGGTPKGEGSPSAPATGASTTAPPTTPPATTAASPTPPPSSPSATSGPTGSPVAPGSKPVVGATVDVGQLPFGIARDSTSVWVANQGSGTVSQIDPETHKVVRTRQGVPNAFEIAAGLDSVWVTDQQQTLYRMDPAGGKPQAIPMQGGAFGVTIGFGSVWVTNDQADTVTRLDADGNVVASVPVGQTPHGIAAGTDSVWVANEQGTVTRIDPASNEQTADIEVPGEAFQVAEAEGSVWVTNGVSQVFRIDPGKNEVADTINVSGGSFDVVGGFGSVWLTKAGDNTFVRIDPDTGKEADVVRVGTSPRLVTVGPEGLWVANGDSESVSLVHP